MSGSIIQPDVYAPGGVLLPFTTCRTCIKLRRALKEPWFTCSCCEARLAAEAVKRKRVPRAAKRIAIEVGIVAVFLAVMVFADAARHFR